MRAVPADVEYLIAQALEAGGIEAGPPPVPAYLDAPHAIVWRTGGHRIALVIDRSIVSVDVYGTTWGEATETAAQAVAIVQNMALGVFEGVQFGQVWIVTLPYTNPDPNHPTLPRVTFSAEVITKARLEKEASTWQA